MQCDRQACRFSFTPSSLSEFAQEARRGGLTQPQPHAYVFERSSEHTFAYQGELAGGHGVIYWNNSAQFSDHARMLVSHSKTLENFGHRVWSLLVSSLSQEPELRILRVTSSLLDRQSRPPSAGLNSSLTVSQPVRHDKLRIKGLPGTAPQSESGTLSRTCLGAQGAFKYIRNACSS